MARAQPTMSALIHCDRRIGSSGVRAPSDWVRALHLLLRASDACASGIVVRDFAAVGGWFSHAVGVRPEFVESYDRRLAEFDPWFVDGRPFADVGCVVLGQSIVADRDLVDTAFYGSWLRPQRLRHCVFGVLDRSEHRAAVLFLARSDERGAFDANDVERLKTVLPPLSVAWQMQRDAEERASTATTIWPLLDHLAVGCVVLDPESRARYCNRAAADIVRRTDALAFVDGRLAAIRPGDAQRLRAAIAAVSERPPSPVPPATAPLTVTLTRGGEGPGLQLLLRTIYPDGEHRPALVAVFLCDPERIAPVSEPWLSETYGLTRVQARVAALLCSGATVDEVAGQMHISVHTVRSYLKDVFAKVGVNRQAAMIGRLVSAPIHLFVDAVAEVAGRTSRPRLCGPEEEIPTQMRGERNVLGS